MSKFTESTVEEAVLEWFDDLEYAVMHGPEIAPDEPSAERASYSEVILADRLRSALTDLNPDIPDDAIEDAYRRVIQTETPSLPENNRRFHRMLVDGVDVEYHADGRIVHDKVWLVDFDAPCLHTMYVDKPTRGHGLMQAIARVNRVFQDKPGGLIVDYLGLAAELKKTLKEYTEQDRDNVGIPTDQAVEVLLEKSIRAYQNRSLTAAQVIAELVNLAKKMREAHRRGEDLGMSDDEIAFYDALEVNDSAVSVLGDDKLRAIAHELVESVRRNVTIDWTVKESARAKLRTLVKRILRKYGYPPDKQAKATETVLKQAELLCADWAG